jgi:hypothetical protein
MLALGIVLLTSGFMLELKSTTITGALVTFIYVATLLVYLPWSKVSTAAIFIMVGGSVIFGAGLLLSLYRDRLLLLPQRIQRREGLFRVLNWR